MRFLFILTISFIINCGTLKLNSEIKTAVGIYKETKLLYHNQSFTQTLILNTDSTYVLDKHIPPFPKDSKGTWRIINDSVLHLMPFDKYFPDDERDSTYFDSLQNIKYTKTNEDGNIEIIEVPRINNSMYVISIKAYGDFIYKGDSICYNNGIDSKGCFIKEKR